MNFDSRNLSSRLISFVLLTALHDSGTQNQSKKNSHEHLINFKGIPLPTGATLQGSHSEPVSLLDGGV